MRRRLSVSVLSLGLGAALAGPSHALTFARHAPVFPERAYTCRLNGDDVALGERRCLRTDAGAHLAQCAIVLNMSSWQAMGPSCP